MSVPENLDRLLEAIAKANGHSHPAEWAAAVKANLEPGADVPASEGEPAAPSADPAQPAAPATEE